MSPVCQRTVVKIASIHSVVYDVFCGASRGFEGVVDTLPCEAYVLALDKGCRGCDRQWLHNGVIVAVYGMEVTQDSLVDGTCDGELEGWVVGQAHVAEVLVGEHLNDGRWHLWFACLAVVAVPELASCPFAVIGA